MDRVKYCTTLLSLLIFVACGGQPTEDPDSTIQDNISPPVADVPSAPTLVSSYISFNSTRIAVGNISQLSVTGVYSNGTSAEAMSSGGWTSSDESVATIDSLGVLTPVSAGTVSVIHSLNGVSSSQEFTITSAVLVGLSLNDLNFELSAGLSKQLAATGLYDDGSSQDLTQLVSWSTGDVSISNFSSPGVLLAVSAGATTVSVDYGGFSVSTNMTVSSKTVSSLSVSPSYVSAPIGSSQFMLATAIFSDNSFGDVTDLVSWTSSNELVATVGNSSGVFGALDRIGSGSSIISAELNGIIGSTVVISTGASLVSVNIGRTDFNLPVGSQDKLSLVGTFSDASTIDLTEQAIWSSSNSNIVAVNNSTDKSGEVYSLAEGSSVITGSYGGQSSQLTITAVNSTLSTISISPGNILLAKDVDQQFSATGTYSDGSEVDITELVSWSSSNQTHAVVSNTNGSRGILNNLFAGSSTETITVTAGLNSITSSVDVILTPNSIESILITPSNVNMHTLTNQNFTAIASFDDGASSDITAYVTWSSSDNSLGVVSNAINSGGRFTAIAEGSPQLTATLGSFSASSAISVNNSTAESSEDIGVGLKGDYYTGLNFNVFKGSRIDSEVDFNLGRGQAPLGVGDSYSVRWTGRFVPQYTEEYTLYTTSDDGVRLFVDDVEIISNWTNHAATLDSATINLEAGRSYDIKLEFFENGGHSRIELSWESASQTRQIIPKEYLFHE
ncbi:MAG: Ig-like domain-containing protein [Bdellovibrionales bacterium]